ncbi:MAG: hypothetical protein ACLR0U_21520 [Enterocloster clostridioformis]
MEAPGGFCGCIDIMTEEGAPRDWELWYVSHSALQGKSIWRMPATYGARPVTHWSDKDAVTGIEQCA